MRRATDGRRMVAGVRGVPRAIRSGFTLVELLISISIFVILATIALSAFRGSDKDKITAASRQVQAVFNGARSRAAKSGEPRGVRLLLDPADPRCVNALQYIGASTYHTGSVRVQLAASDRDASNAPRPLVRIVCEQNGEWADLIAQGLLDVTARIRIPADSSGHWYTITNVNGSAGTGEIRQLPAGATWNATCAYDSGNMANVGSFQFSPPGPLNTGTARTSAPDFYSNTLPVSYLLRLEPQPLPNTTPISLPLGIVIDLDASQVPTAWRQYEDDNRNGVLDSGDDLDGDGQLNFSGHYGPNIVPPPSSPPPVRTQMTPVNLDIMFGPDGTATGAFAALGPLFLTISHVSDVELARPMRVVDNVTTRLPAIVPGDYQDSYGSPQDFPNKERRVVAIYPQTGNVFVSQLNGASTNVYRLADNPFDYAYAGRDSK